jgi:protocatechuate 3,4-dioxygenase beta subunit
MIRRRTATPTAPDRPATSRPDGADPSGDGHDHGGGHDHDEDHHRGLAFDAARMLDRRRALALLGGGVAAVGLAACGSSGSDSASTTSTTTSTTAAAGPGGGPGGAPPGGGSTATVAEGSIPEETAGPFPGDGSNGPDVLSESGIVRRDLTTSIGSASGVAEGIPTTVVLKLVDVANGSAPRSGAAVYLWHCTREGGYSMYSSGVEDENFLRGVQEAGDDGTVTFDTIFPAAYDGRWPHMHFEIYESLDAATSAGTKLRTTQLALPQAACDEVYATEGYEDSVANLARTSLDGDMVFADGYSLQLAKAAGTVDDGYTVTLTVPV